MAGHIRGLFFLDYRDLATRSPFVAALYGVTGLGHQAVMVFFVLSGFFIGGGVLASIQNWNWKRYLANRLSRLYLVLLPALVLTGGLDYLAYRRPAGHFYFDQPIYHFNPRPIAGQETPGAFLGNALFLQTIAAPTFGSNGPLWSLANEFWYYVLFPALALAALSRRRMKRRVAGFVIAGALLAWLPGGMLAGFLIWLLGVLIWLSPVVSLPRSARLALIALSAGCFGLVLTLARSGRLPGPWGDFPVGIAFAAWLYSLIRLRASRTDVSPGYRWLSGRLSKCSYSVYAVHFPLVLLIRTSVGRRLWTPTVLNLSLWGVVAFGVFLFGLLFSKLTEAKTDVVRRWLLRVLGESKLTLRPVFAGTVERT